MALTDVEELVRIVSEGDSCGENLEADEVFRRIESEIEGDSTDWYAVENTALDLLKRTKDVRVLVALIAASLREPSAGLRGFRAGLSALRLLIQTHGDQLHPQIDAEEPRTGLRARAMAIDELGSEFGTQGDEYQVIARMRFVPLTTAGESFTFRDVMILRGELANAQPDADKDESNLQAAVAQTLSRDRAYLDGLAEDARGSLGEIEAIEALFSERKLEVTGVPSLELDPLKEQITRIADEVERHLPQQAGGGDPVTLPGQPQVGVTPGVGVTQGGRGDRIESRADVLAALEAIQQYYRDQEPSSPVPLLLQRASRFVNMNFVDIVQDIAGNEIDNMNVIFGSSDKGS